MRTYIFIYLSILFGIFNNHPSSTKGSFSSEEIVYSTCKHEQKEICAHQKFESSHCLASCEGTQLSKIVKQDTSLGIDMGYFPLPNCWSGTKNGLIGPDSTIVTHSPMTYKAKLKTDYEATELLGYQAIINNCIKEDIIPELFKTKARVKSISFNEELSKRYQAHFSNLYPCSTPPAYFNVAVLEDEDMSGNPGLNVLYFMIFETPQGYVLYCSKNSLFSKPASYAQNKKDYLFALAHAEYFPEYVERIRESQKQSTQDDWYKLNDQLLSNLSFSQWRSPWEPGFEGDFRPWRSNRFGEHEKYLQYFSSNDTLSLYDPETDYNIDDSSWKEFKTEDAKN